MKEKIICILNNRATLTIGKEYEVLSSNGRYITVINDYGDEVEYTKERFIDKSKFRGHKLDQILK